MRDQLNKGEHLLTPLKQKKKSFFQGGETKRMKTRKLLASFLAFAMLLSIVAVPVGSADAATTYSATSVPSFADGTTGPQKLGSIKISVDPLTTTSSAIFKLPAGAIVDMGQTVINPMSGTTTAASVVAFGGDNEFRVNINKPGTAEESHYILDVYANIRGLSNGEVAVAISNIQGELPSGNVVVATIGSGTVGVTAETPEYIAGTGSLTPAPGKNKTIITLTEKQSGALKAGTLTFVLPDGFEWVTGNASGLVSGRSFVTAPDSQNKRELDVTIAGSYGGKDVVRIEAAITVNDLKARHGDVVATVRGNSSLDTNRIVVAKYGDFGVKLEAKDATKIIAGRGADGRTAETGEIGTIVIEETAPGSLVEGRTIYLKLPAGAKWNIDNIDDKIVSGNGIVDNKVRINRPATTKDALIDWDATENNDKNRTLRLVVGAPVGATGAGKVELKGLRVDTGIGFSGDLEVEVSGNAGVAGKVKVAEATPAVKVTIDKVDVQIGTRAQKVGKITIEEQFAGALMKATSGSGEFKFGFDNVMTGLFTKSGSATVTGDEELEVKMGTDKNTAGVEKTVLVLKVDRESSKPAKIEITGVEITLDRTVPEGDFMVNVGTGSALQDTKQTFGGAVGRIAQLPIATVVTPAPGAEPGAAKVVFTQDAKEYTVNGEQFLAEDAAPFNKDGRVFVPIRLLATALGVSEDDIVFNVHTKQVTIFKGDRIAQFTIGSDILTVNGAAVQMDTKVELKDGRTYLPVRYAAQAFNAPIAWDAATKTVTVN